MKCPECVQAGLRSRVYIGPSSTTCMGTSAFYDENGVLHIHDPNTTATSYRCSNGHGWFEKSRRSCRACNAKSQDGAFKEGAP